MAAAFLRAVLTTLALAAAAAEAAAEAEAAVSSSPSNGRDLLRRAKNFRSSATSSAAVAGRTDPDGAAEAVSAAASTPSSRSSSERLTEFTYQRQKQQRRSRRRNQQEGEEDGAGTPDADTTDSSASVIFGITPKDFDKIMSSDIAHEFGIYELGIDRATELWDAYADFELDRALQAERDFVEGKAGVTLQDVEFPYLLCSKKAGRTGAQRRRQIVDIVQYSFDPLDVGHVSPEQAALAAEPSIFSIYNSEEMSCYGARFAASVALTFAKLQDPQLPILPIHSYMKIRAGAVQELLTRAKFPDYWSSADNETEVVDEATVDYEEQVSTTSENRLDVTLCAGMDVDEQQNIGSKLMTFMTAKSSSSTGAQDEEDAGSGAVSSLLSLSNKYAGSTPEELDELPSRVKFWLDVYRTGIDSDQGCDDMLERLEFEVLSSPTGDALGFYVALGPATGNGDISPSTTLACVCSLIAGIALLPQVCSVELNSRVSVGNSNAQWILQDPLAGSIDDESIESRPFWNAGITGKGQVVGVSDSGLDTDNCYFLDSTGDIAKDGSTDTSRRKIVQYDPYVDAKDDAGGHGTHVCGTICGHKAEDGRTESTGLADGVARDAKVAFFDAGGGGDSLSIPGDKSKFLGVGTSAGAKIHSSSWGSFLTPYKYDTMSRDIDHYIFDDWNFLLIVAAGNEGSGNREKSILSPAVGKNVLTVGASQSTNFKGIDYLADFSSRGPTSDDRIKPDVVAPGQSILSSYADPGMVGECDPADGLTYKQGTSMATPATSGAAALVRQYFLEGHFPSKESIDPSGMLLKAVLINGAQEISYIDNGIRQTPTTYYDSNQGFGRVSLVDSLPLPGSNSFNASFIDKGVIQDGDTIRFQINITKAGGGTRGCALTQMRTTLVWADPPGASGCTKCLVNNLDLSLTKNDDPTVYYPNGRDSADTRNNVERIIVDADDGDTVFIAIHAANLDRPDQVFSLFATGCMEAEDYVGEVQPEGHSNNNNTIIIIVCSVVGVIIVLGLGWFLCARGQGNRK